MDLGSFVVEKYLQVNVPVVNPQHVRLDENITVLYRQLPDTRPAVLV